MFTDHMIGWVKTRPSPVPRIFITLPCWHQVWIQNRPFHPGIPLWTILAPPPPEVDRREVGQRLRKNSKHRGTSSQLKRIRANLMKRKNFLFAAEKSNHPLQVHKFMKIHKFLCCYWLHALCCTSIGSLGSPLFHLESDEDLSGCWDQKERSDR